MVGAAKVGVAKGGIVERGKSEGWRGQGRLVEVRYEPRSAWPRAERNMALGGFLGAGAIGCWG